MNVRELMVAPVITAREDASLEELARTMLDRKIGCLPVVSNDGALCGIVTESDFAAKDCGVPFSMFRWPRVLGQWLPQDGLEQIYAKARAMTARQIMTTNVRTVSEDATIEQVVKQMVDGDLRRLPVVRGRQVIGVISRHDLLRLLLPNVG